MAQPGWYPDPEGGPTPRWWDGRSWAPRPHGSGQPPKGRGGLVVGLAIGVVFVGLLAGLLILRPWDGTAPVGTDTRTARPTGTQWDERKTSPDPDEEGSERPCPMAEGDDFVRGRGNTFTSSGMSFDGVSGWEDSLGWSLDFATQRTGQEQWVAEGWVAAIAMGGLDVDEYSSDPRTAASQVADCMSSWVYEGLLGRSELTDDRAYTTSDGVAGWLLEYNYWNNDDVELENIEGDVVVFLVLDTGDPQRLTIFHSQVPIGDDALTTKVDAAQSSLRRA